MKQAPYDVVAGEYYEADLHPTCRAFRELTLNFVGQLDLSPCGFGEVLEVGCGRSVVGDLCDGQLNWLTLTDESSAMLAHSEDSAARGACLVCAPVEDLPFSENRFDLVVASLGDPYNSTPAWTEVARVMRKGGRLVFTTPHYDWAQAFRSASNPQHAEFVTRAGEVAFVPSRILSPSAQIKEFESLGLIVESSTCLTVDDISGPPAPKLQGVQNGKVLSGYLIKKPY